MRCPTGQTFSPSSGATRSNRGEVSAGNLKVISNLNKPLLHKGILHLSTEIVIDAENARNETAAFAPKILYALLDSGHHQ